MNGQSNQWKVSPVTHCTSDTNVYICMCTFDNIYIHMRMTTEPAESIEESSKFKSNDEQNLGHKDLVPSEPKSVPGKREFDWRIINVKIVCFVFIVVAWFIVATPYASLVRYFLSPEVNATDTANTQMERIDSICSVINNSTLGFRGNRSSNLSLECDYPYVSNGSICVPLCGSWHPAGRLYHILTRAVLCVTSLLSLICSLLGILTWFIIGKKLFQFPQVIPFYLFICTAIQALCILIGQIQFGRFYCSHTDLLSSRIHPTPQCYIQGAIYHYTTLVFFFWYVSYVVTVLLILSFPFKLRPTESSNWKTHLILFLVSFCVPLLVLVVFWGVDPVRYEIVSNPSVCFPGARAIVVMFLVPITLALGLSLTSVLLIVSQLIINKLRLGRHIQSGMNTKQTHFIVRTLGVIISFTVIALFIMLEFGSRISFLKAYDSYVELYWACITRYGTNTSCCVDNYTQYYHPNINLLHFFFISIWGIVALSTLAVKEARKFWINLFTKCCRCCCYKVSSIPKQELSSSSGTQLKRRKTELLVLHSCESNKTGGIGTETKDGTQLEGTPTKN